MSVYTTADNFRDAAVLHMDKAIAALHEIVWDKCWGHDHYTLEYRSLLEQTMFQLRRMRQELKND